MALNIEIKFNEEKNSWYFYPEGDIDIYTSSKLKKVVLDNYESNEKDIVIDGKSLSYIDSTGLGALIYILKKMKNDNKIFLDNIKPNIKKLFDITELDKLFFIRGEDNE